MAHHDLLLGTWIGEGRGEYPTIEPFDYRETLTIEALPGRPMASWRSVTVDAASGEPRHTEVGFVRSSESGSELVLAHGFAITEIALAAPSSAGTIRFESSELAGSPTAKEVTQVVRSFTVADGELAYETAMAAVGEPLTHHLSARLRRQ